MRMLMTGLIRNSTITYLDVSHNKITNHGEPEKQQYPTYVCTRNPLCPTTLAIVRAARNANSAAVGGPNRFRRTSFPLDSYCSPAPTHRTSGCTAYHRHLLRMMRRFFCHDSVFLEARGRTRQRYRKIRQHLKFSAYFEVRHSILQHQDLDYGIRSKEYGTWLCRYPKRSGMFISSPGARLLSKLLGENSVLSSLNLADNQVS